MHSEQVVGLIKELTVLENCVSSQGFIFAYTVEPRFTYTTVYVCFSLRHYVRRLVENVDSDYVQIFDLHKLTSEFWTAASWGIQRGGMNPALECGFSSSGFGSRDRFMKENTLIASKKRTS